MQLRNELDISLTVFTNLWRNIPNGLWDASYSNSFSALLACSPTYICQASNGANCCALLGCPACARKPALSGKKEQWILNVSPRLMTSDLKHDLQALVLSETLREIQSKDVGPWHPIHPHISPSQIQLHPGTEHRGSNGWSNPWAIAMSKVLLCASLTPSPRRYEHAQ